jgi:hyperosmotically inducible protein
MEENQQTIGEPSALDSDASKHGAIGHLSADEELQQAVCAALIDSPKLDSSDIGVRVANGLVILTGSVRSTEDRNAALRVARAQSGASDVDGGGLLVS